MTRKESDKFIKKNESLFKSVFVSAKDQTGKDYGKKRNELVKLARAAFKIAPEDRDDAFVLNKLLGHWQYFRGAPTEDIREQLK